MRKLSVVGGVGIIMMMILAFSFLSSTFNIKNSSYFYKLSFAVYRQMDQRENKDIDRIYDRMVKCDSFPRFLFLWTKNSMVKDRELYEFALKLYQEEKIQEEKEKKINDKTFENRLKNIKEK